MPRGMGRATATRFAGRQKTDFSGRLDKFLLITAIQIAATVLHS
jgi:hypothetical protein